MKPICMFCQEEMKLKKIKYRPVYEIKHRCPKSNTFWHYIKKRYPAVDFNVIKIAR